MKERIIELLNSYAHDVLNVKEDEMYMYFVLDTCMICSIALGELINEGFTFIIDLDDSENNKLTIAFEK